MLGALFGQSTNGQQFHPPTVHLEPGAPYFGPLGPEDLEWACAGGFVVETQSFYTTTPSGSIISCQVIHSAVGLWYPQINFTFGFYDTSDPSKPRRIWKSVNVTNFTAPPPPTSKGIKLDKRSAKSDQFAITVDPSNPDTYQIEGKYDDEVNVAFEITRLPGVPGWKLGSGPRGGMSYFGNLKPAKSDGSKLDCDGGSDGYVIHRFWPRCSVKGIVRVGKNVIDLDGSARGMFVHAIQGMRPNLVATRWNFADFQSSAADGVSLIKMQFTTPSSYGTKSVSVGSVVVGDKLISVTVGTDEVEGSSATHIEKVVDKETGYKVPLQIAFVWTGPPIDKKSSTDLVKASINLDVRPEGPSSPSTFTSKGFIEKVDVLAEIPYLVKKVVNVVAGTKPYIYQWLNPVEANISLPASGDQATRRLTVKGYLFTEASFISEP